MVEDSTIRDEKQFVHRKVLDQYGNTYELVGELSRGGQGVVYKTSTGDYVVKQPLDPLGEPDRSRNLENHFNNIRLLPLPKGVHVTLPVATLEGEPGYVMRFLDGMKSFAARFEFDGDVKKKLVANKPELAEWMKSAPNEEQSLLYYHFAKTGGIRTRLYALYKCAAELSRLHSAGIVYGDISPNNVFIQDEIPGQCWLIDADNIRLEGLRGGKSLLTPGYGAPEVVQRKDESRPRTDCWAFAVMAYRMLTTIHPFLGAKVQSPDDDAGDWGSDDGSGICSPDDKAYAGLYPFIDDPSDRSNAFEGPIPRALLLTPGLVKLFEETFCSGRTSPWLRPPMRLWAFELAKAHDATLACPVCGMSYYSMSGRVATCPYCDSAHPRFARVKTDRWMKLFMVREKDRVLFPQRMFSPFSVSSGDATVASLRFDLKKKPKLDLEQGCLRPGDWKTEYSEDKE